MKKRKNEVRRVVRTADGKTITERYEMAYGHDVVVVRLTSPRADREDDRT